MARTEPVTCELETKRANCGREVVREHGKDKKTEWRVIIYVTKGRLTMTKCPVMQHAAARCALRLCVRT